MMAVLPYSWFGHGTGQVSAARHRCSWLGTLTCGVTLALALASSVSLADYEHPAGTKTTAGSRDLSMTSTGSFSDHAVALTALPAEDVTQTFGSSKRDLLSCGVQRQETSTDASP